MSNQLDKFVAAYIKLRDAKAALAAKYKEQLVPIETAMGKIEAALLQTLNSQGAQSVKTPEGTVYKTSRTSATASEWDTFLAWVRENEHWNFLERRVSKTAVEEYRTEFQDIPPGISVREEVTVNIRR
jgi:hypothetical protein